MPDGAIGLDRARGIDVPAAKRRLGYVFQGLALFPHLGTRKNVEYALADLPRAEREARVHALLERMGVAALAERKPRTLSGGEAQRVAIAALVRALVDELGVPAVHVTHSETEAAELGARVVRIENARSDRARIRTAATRCSCWHRGAHQGP